MMHTVRAITLDLDDTLWAIAPVIERAERRLWAWLDRHYPRVTAHWNSDKVMALRDAVVAEHPGQAHDLRFLRKTVLARMADAAGYADDLVEPAFAVFDAERNTVDLFPDVLPGLERLGADYRLIAVTNGNACLDTIGIRELFDDIVTAVDVGAAKPDARIFAAASERAGLPASEILHVGDHPELDVAGARDAGMRTAWVNRNGGAWPAQLVAPDTTVASMLELADWLADLRPAGD